MRANLLKSLIAVVLGNVLFVLAVEPHIPAAGRHQAFKLDLGLVIDFWVCVACWGVIEMASRRFRRR